MKLRFDRKDKGFVVIYDEHAERWHSDIVGVIQRRNVIAKHKQTGKLTFTPAHWRVQIRNEREVDFIDLEQAKAYARAVLTLTQ